MENKRNNTSRVVTGAEFLEEAWTGTSNCFVILSESRTILDIGRNKGHILSDYNFNNCLIALIDKGIDKCGLDFRAADLGICYIVARKNEFNSYLRKNNLDKYVKPIGKL